MVRPEDLESLLAGNDPRTGAHVATWLTRPGYDVTLSAPKSVSLLWALGDDRVATVVREAHDEAAGPGPTGAVRRRRVDRGGVAVGRLSRAGR